MKAGLVFGIIPFYMHLYDEGLVTDEFMMEFLQNHTNVIINLLLIALIIVALILILWVII